MDYCVVLTNSNPARDQFKEVQVVAFTTISSSDSKNVENSVYFLIFFVNLVFPSLI